METRGPFVRPSIFNWLTLSDNTERYAIIVGSLTITVRFIEDYAMYAAILYELRDVDFHAWQYKLETKESTTTEQKEK